MKVRAKQRLIWVQRRISRSKCIHFFICDEFLMSDSIIILATRNFLTFNFIRKYDITKVKNFVKVSFFFFFMDILLLGTSEKFIWSTNLAFPTSKYVREDDVSQFWNNFFFENFMMNLDVRNVPCHFFGRLVTSKKLNFERFSIPLNFWCLFWRISHVHFLTSERRQKRHKKLHTFL